MRGREDECVPEIQKVLSYATFVQDEENEKLKGLKEVVTGDVKQKILMIFENSIGSELEESDGKDVVDQQRDLLCVTVGIDV